MQTSDATGALLYAGLTLIFLVAARRRSGSGRRHPTSALPPAWFEPTGGPDRPTRVPDHRAVRLCGSRTGIALLAATWGALSVLVVAMMILHGGSIQASADVSNRSVWNASSTSQYSLAGNDGTSWVEIDSTNLSLSITPTVTSTALLTANAALFTNTAGYNQDLAIEVNGATPPVVWKEAGGYSPFRPATVYDQAAYTMTAGQTYTVALYWKTNVNEGTATIFDGAGSASPHSPTTLSAVLTPASEGLVDSATSTGSQYTTSSTSWTLMDSTNLDTTFTPSSTGTALLTASADVFTTTAGTNQDLGICVAAAGTITAGCANGTVVTWAENAGANTYMPIAALVQGTSAVTSGTTYTVGVVWRASSANAIDAGAGPSSPHSFASVIVQIVPTSDSELSAAATAPTTQLTRSYGTSDNGTTWADMSTSSLALSLNPATNMVAYFGGNASLFANSVTFPFNVDLGVCVAAGNGACNNVGWTESGSATAFSPDANFVATPYALSGGTSYTVKLQWRTSSAMASGNEIFAGAGSYPSYSPTSLSAFLVPYTAPGAPTNVVARPVTTANSTAATVTWTAPVSPGSSISKYTITPYIGTTAQTALAQTDTTANSQGVIATSYGIPGLTMSAAYTFQVTATNMAGTGLPGVSNVVAPQPPPAYTIAGAGGTHSSPLVTAPAKGYDDGKAAQDGTTPQQVALGQVANTIAGWPDVITANGSGANGGDSISVLQNLKSTNGSFSQPAMTTAPGEAATQVALGNLFGHIDGVQDAVVVNGGSTIYVLRNRDDGSGSFTQAASYTLPPNQGQTANYVALANMHSTSGSTLDIVTLGTETGCGAEDYSVVSVWLNSGNGSFGAPSQFSPWPRDCSLNSFSIPNGLVVADFNGDGLNDIAYTSHIGGPPTNGDNLGVLLNSGNGSFSINTVGGGFNNSAGTAAVSQIVAGAFTGNGINDIAVVTDEGCCSGTKRGVTVFMGKGDGTFPANVYFRDPALDGSPASGFPTGIAVADMNGDGTPDIVTSDSLFSGAGGFSVYLNTGTQSSLDLPVFLPTTGFIPAGIALGNVSGHPDGEADVVLEANGATSPSNPSNVEVLINGTDFPALGSALGANEMHGCLMCQALAAGGSLAVNGDWPISVNSGEMSHTFTDISIPARGYPIQVTQTYNSLNGGSSATDYGLGYGWWSPLLMSLTQNATTGITTVTQEDGAQAQFWTTTLAPVAPRIQATLVHNGDGTWTFTRYSGDTFTFNASGQITKLQDLTGDYLSFGYSGTPSVVTSMTHADGRSLSIAWSNGDIASITDSNVTGQTRTVLFTYGTSTHAHELVQIDWKVNGTNDRNEQFTYDETTWVHGLASMQDPDGHVVAQTYNSDGTTATQTIDPSSLNRQTVYSYWPARTSTYSAISAALITDPVGRQEVDEFAYGEMVQKTTGFTGCSTTLSGTWPSGTGCNSSNIATTTSSFDPTSIGTTLTVDPNGNTSTATYDSRGNVLSKTDGMGRTTSYTYTSTDATFYHPSTMTDGTQVTTTYSYDPTYHMLTRVCTPLPTGACGSTPTMPAKVITYTYGNSSHPGDLMSTTNGDSKTTNYGYDTYGNRGETQDPTGAVTATEFNADGWTIATWTPKGTCTFSTSLTNGQPPSGCSSTYETIDTYADTNGNDVFWPDVLRVNAPLNRVSSATYDADNNVTKAVDFNGNPTTYAYDNAGEPCWTLPGGTSTNGCGSPPTNARVTDYNGDGQIGDQKNGLGNTLQSYAYDSRGNVTTLTVDPGSSPHLNQATTYTYDANGNALTKTDPGGSCTGTISGCTTYTYNADNQVCWYLVGASSNGCGSVPSTAVSYTYDNDGQRSGMSDATGSWSYTVNALHQLTSVTEAQGGGNSATIGYQYNYRDEPTQITYPGTTGSVTIGYDNAGRESSVTDWNSKTTTFNYDADGNLTTTVFPSGSCSPSVSLCDTNTYNAADQMTGISDMQNSTTSIFSATYTRDGNGQVTSDSSALPGQNNYGYTALNQLCYAGSNNTSACPSPPSGSQPFAYDNGDNLTTFGGRTQAFNTADELCWTVGGTSSNGCSTPPSGATSYSYDSRDNRTAIVPSSGAATCYTFSEPNWLTQIQTGSGSSCSSPTTVGTYVNNGDGLRMSKTVGSTTTRAAWDLSGSLPLQLVDGATDYVYGPRGMVLEQISGSTTLWYHHDQVGTVRAITDASGIVKATYRLDPYGNVNACTGATVTVNGSNICTGTITVSNPFVFNAQYRDDESGLYYLRARYYDPTTGQFLSRDPATATTLSPYGYVLGNPLNGTDPRGLDCGFLGLGCVASAVSTAWNDTTSWVSNNASTIAQVATVAAVGVATAACVAATDGLCAVAMPFIGAATGPALYAESDGPHTWEGYGMAFAEGGIGGSLALACFASCAIAGSVALGGAVVNGVWGGAQGAWDYGHDGSCEHTLDGYARATAGGVAQGAIPWDAVWKGIRSLL